jgi:hypothetical protein
MTEIKRGDEATQYGVAEFRGHNLFEHYNEDGHLVVITSDVTALDLEPGDFVVLRSWTTLTMPYVHQAVGPVKPVEVPTTSSGEVVDLLAQLQRSVDAAKAWRSEPDDG